MKKIFKSIIAIILVVSMLLATSVVAFAASSIQEEYISDIRLIYADTYEEAKLVLTESKLEGYKILNNNLNANSGKKGVWLAYKTTTDIDDAITDVAVIQMGGGYSAANYQAMIEQSRGEYEAMGEIYLDAIDYFAEAYDEGNFLAEAAYRQLSFYAGLDKYKTSRLGDLFLDGVLKKADLATLFFEGNAKILDNVRSLIAMGVSYNEDGMHYLEKVGKMAEAMGSTIEYNKEYNDLSQFIAPVITTFKTMFEELAAYEAELNYADEELTDVEIKYAEYKAIADRMRAIRYLDGKTLYDFCMDYSVNKNDYTSIYPLAAALNEGQVAMTKVSHYYDVVRYSMSDAPEEVIDQEITELEEKYKDDAVDVFLGVDRDIYDQTFALTTAAYRADAYTDSNSLTDALFGSDTWRETTKQLAMGALGVGLSVWAIVRTAKGGFGVPAEQAVAMAKNAVKKAEDKAYNLAEDLATERMESWGQTYMDVVENLYTGHSMFDDKYVVENWDALDFGDKINEVKAILSDKYGFLASNDEMDAIMEISHEYTTKMHNEFKSGLSSAKRSVGLSVYGGRIFTGLLYLAGAASLAYSAYSLYKQIHDHYHPKYDEIPMAMVDLVKTVDGDRYIKYDVVLDTKLQDGEYHAADLNAFEGERWNALYYTKNSEAGMPLLADFEISNSNNSADKGYSPVHRFGEVVCYDLNKYNFSSKSDTIFVSIRQSENLKSDYADVPDIVGAIIGEGFWALAGCLGVVIGAGGTILTNRFLNKKKSKENGTDDAVA